MTGMLVTCRLEATDQITVYQALRLLGKALFSLLHIRTHIHTYKKTNKREKTIRRRGNDEEKWRRIGRKRVFKRPLGLFEPWENLEMSDKRSSSLLSIRNFRWHSLVSLLISKYYSLSRLMTPMLTNYWPHDCERQPLALRHGLQRPRPIRRSSNEEMLSDRNVVDHFSMTSTVAMLLLMLTSTRNHWVKALRSVMDV